MTEPVIISINKALGLKPDQLLTYEYINQLKKSSLNSQNENTKKNHLSTNDPTYLSIPFNIQQVNNLANQDTVSNITLAEVSHVNKNHENYPKKTYREKRI